MIFKRRERRSFWRAVRDLAVPRKGWRRGFKYIGKRVQRLPDTPHRIALGFACGAFASFTPLFTLHAFVAVFLAWAIRANMIAAAFGTIVGNPLTITPIALTCLQLGNWMLGRTWNEESLEKISFDYAFDQPIDFIDTIFTPYGIGGVVPGLLCGLAFYLLLRPMVAGFQRRRRQKLAARAKELIAERERRRAERGGGSDGPQSPDGRTPDPADAAARGPGAATLRRPPIARRTAPT